MVIEPDDPLAGALVAAIRSGDVDGLQGLLDDHPGLARAWVSDGCCRRSTLHLATDWPGKLPGNRQILETLVAAGAEVNAPFVGPHRETPLHWAASNDDLDGLDFLLASGAAIDAGGGVIGGGTPLDDAVAFGQWRAANLLIDRGATVGFWQAAAMGMLERLVECVLTADPGPDEITHAFWCACHGGSHVTAQYLLALDAELDWVGHDDLTPLDAAEREHYPDLVSWLRAMGAHTAGELETAAQPSGLRIYRVT